MSDPILVPESSDTEAEATFSGANLGLVSEASSPEIDSPQVESDGGESYEFDLVPRAETNVESEQLLVLLEGIQVLRKTYYYSDASWRITQQFESIEHLLLASPDAATAVAETMNNPPVLALQAMNMLEQVAAFLISESDEAVMPESAVAIRQGIAFAENHQSMLVRQASRLSCLNLDSHLYWHTRLDDDNSDMDGQSPELRAHLELLSEAYARLDEKVAYGADSHNQTRAVSMASDATGIMDSSYWLEFIAQVPKSELDNSTPDQPITGISPERFMHSLYPSDPAKAERLVAAFYVMHEPVMRASIEDELGVRFDDVRLQAQCELLNILVDSRADYYARLVEVMHAQPELGADFLESFLALDQGHEFGESLLSLAENLAPDELHEVLSRVVDIRDAATALADRFGEADEVIGSGIKAGILQRTTCVLKAAEKLALDNEPYELTVSGKTMRITDLSQITQALDLVLKSCLGAASGSAAKHFTDGDLEVFMLSSSPTAIVTRSTKTTVEGRNADWERGKAPRANILTVVDGAPIPEVPTIAFWEAHALSLRIDYQDGGVGLDFGGKAPAGSPDWEVAQVISAGAALLARERGEDDEDYHFYGFEPTSAEEFADFIQNLRYQLSPAGA